MLIYIRITPIVPENIPVTDDHRIKDALGLALNDLAPFLTVDVLKEAEPDAVQCPPPTPHSPPQQKVGVIT